MYHDGSPDNNPEITTRLTTQNAILVDIKKEIRYIGVGLGYLGIGVSLGFLALVLVLI